MNRVTRETEYRNPDQIRQDIDRTRADIDGTVEALEGRLTPGRMVDELWNRVSHSETGGGFAEVVRDHPVPLALMGLGIGWLAVEQSSSRRVGSGTHAPAPGRRGPYGPEAIQSGTGGESSKGISDRMRKAGAGARDKLREAGDKLSGSMSGGEGGSLTERAGESASEAADRTRHQVQHQTQRVRRGIGHMFEENPVALGALAFGIGLASGISVPTTEPEDRIAGGMADTVKGEVKKAGEETMESASEVAKEATTAAGKEMDRQKEKHEEGRS